MSYRQSKSHSREDRFRTHRNNNSEAPNWVRRDYRLSTRVMFGRLAVQGPKGGGRPVTSWVDCLQKNLEAVGAVPRKGKRRKWVAFVVVAKDGRDWVTAVKNVGMWHRGVESEAVALENAWRRTDLRQSNVRRQREASEFVQYLRVWFCFVLPCCCCFYLFSSCDIT